MGQKTVRLAVDIGGTFTVLVLEAGDVRSTLKVLTTHDALERPIHEGSQELLHKARVRPEYSMIAFGDAAPLHVACPAEKLGIVTTIVPLDGVALLPTAFSPIVREYGDLSAGVFAPQGRILAQAVASTPEHVNAMAAGRLSVAGQERGGMGINTVAPGPRPIMATPGGGFDSASERSADVADRDRRHALVS